MRVIVPRSIQEELLTSLMAAGLREIGGVLMGEHVGDQIFAVRQITVQWESGSLATFVRAVQELLQPLAKFFRLTHHDYRRFNYLGEWHSHPSFVPEPSARDCETMWEIVDDREVGANFVVLLIVRLSRENELTGTVTVFSPGHRIARANLVLEEQ